MSRLISADTITTFLTNVRHEWARVRNVLQRLVTDVTADHKSRRRVLGAALWLQLMVTIFIAVQIKNGVRTPPSQWFTKAMNLLGM